MDMDRRGFLKLLGGLATLPIAGKFFKFAKKATTAAPKVLKEQGMPDFFYDLVAGVKKFGKPTKSTRDYDVYEYVDPRNGRRVEVRDGRDEVAIGFESDRGFQAEMGVKKGIPDEMTKGKKPPDEYYEGEQVYYPAGPDDYIKDFETEIGGGYSGLEEVAKKFREGKSGGGIAGSPPVYQTNDPKDALKEIIRRTPFLGGTGEVLPIFSNENMNIETYIGGPQDPVSYGLGAFTNRGDIMLNQLSSGDKQIGVEFGTTTTPNTTFGLGYTEGQGPRFGLQYERRFADGGRAGYVRGGPIVTSATRNELNRYLKEKQKEEQKIKNKTSLDSLMKERREQIIPALKSANVISDNDVSRILQQYGLISLAEGGIASGPPPKRGPLPQGLETLFQTR